MCSYIISFDDDQCPYGQHTMSKIGLHFSEMTDVHTVSET